MRLIYRGFLPAVLCPSKAIWQASSAAGRRAPGTPFLAVPALPWRVVAGVLWGSIVGEADQRGRPL